MEYVLDYSKWRSGGDDETWKVGVGKTRMLNKEGYSCCLGQFAKQVGVSDDLLLNRCTPVPVSDRHGLYDSAFVYKCDSGSYRNTDLAHDLMEINDDPKIRPSERINAIREKLKEHGHTLKVINAPDGIES